MAKAQIDESSSDFSEEELSPLDIAFNKASNHVRKITTKLDTNQLLEIYGLFKQSTEGKCETTKPSWFDGKGRRKWDAWRALDDLPKDKAKQKYIELVKKLDPEFENEDNSSKGVKEAWVAVSSLRISPEPELIHSELSIFEAARENLGDRIMDLIKTNPTLVNERDANGLTALHWAADRDSTVALTTLLNHNCDVNALDDSEQTALHYAVSCGHVKSTQILIDSGALLIKDSDGNFPQDLASEEEICTILKRALST